MQEKAAKKKSEGDKDKESKDDDDEDSLDWWSRYYETIKDQDKAERDADKPATSSKKKTPKKEEETDEEKRRKAIPRITVCWLHVVKIVFLCRFYFPIAQRFHRSTALSLNSFMIYLQSQGHHLVHCLISLCSDLQEGAGRHAGFQWV